MKQRYKKWGVIFLSSVMLFGNAVHSSAAGAGVKEENVYANLNYDGSLENLYVVNAFDLEEETELLDYGKYKSVKNLANDALLSNRKGEVTGTIPSGKFFYQGEMENAQLPWEIAISFLLDGKSVEAEELAGKTGALDLCIRIEENSSAEKEFYENFQLQVMITLDMEKCSALQAPGASVSNVGTKKQLSYLMLPGQEKEIRLTADVLDFEMEPIRFQGVPAALDIESEILSLDDLYEKTESLAERADEFSENALEIQGGANSLKEGISGLTQSAGILKEGLSDYTDGTDMIKDGIGTLYDGSLDLLDGSSQLTNGIATFRDGVNTLDSEFRGEEGLVSGSRELADGMKEMQKASQELTDGMNSMIGMLGQFSEGQSQALDENAEMLIQGCLMGIRTMQLVEPVLEGTKEEQLKILSEYLGQLILQMATNSISDIGTVSDGNEDEGAAGGENQGNSIQSMMLSGLLEMKSKVDLMLGCYKAQNEMEGTLQSEEITELQQGVTAFNSGVKPLADGVSALSGGIAQLADGVGELASGANDLVSGGYELTDGIREFSEGISELSDGTDELKNAAQGLLDGAQQLEESSGDFSEGIQDVADAASSLKEDSDVFKADADEVDEHLDAELDKAMGELSAEEYEPVSFASEKNKNVRLVQFQMKTPEIKIQEAVKPETIDEQPGFLKRLLRLFGSEI